MTISVQTNASAIIALQNLNKTSDQLQGAQNIVSTGLLINTAKDNASVWATSAIEEARFRLDCTAVSAPTSARCPWAMDQTDALSLAVLISRPVETMF